ncbi:MAG: Uma2 family endonuclease [Bacteroidia bacterium]
MITSLSQLDLNGTYSYADYLTWRLQERVELWLGKIAKMSPAPSVKHQRIARKLVSPLIRYFDKHTCQVFFAPFDVRLYDRKKSEKQNKEVFSVVQPDICIICNPDLLDEQGCNGAPDFVIEILSLGNTKADTKIKFHLYAEAGVKEYWIVSPHDENVLQFVLNEENKYQLLQLHTDEDTIIPYLFPEIAIDLQEIFQQ